MAAIARRIALSVLDDLVDKKVTVDSLLSQALERGPSMMQKDRALATELVFGVLRWRGRLDWVIQHFSRTPMKKIASPVLNVIRLGLYQVLFLTRIPAWAAVNDSVELAKARGPRWVVGFVNGILRSAVREARDIPFPDDADDSIGAIAVSQSHPQWMVERWVKRMGVDGARKLCRANNRIPPVTVRANSLLTSRQTLLDFLKDSVTDLATTKHSPDGISFKDSPNRPREIQAPD